VSCTLLIITDGITFKRELLQLRMEYVRFSVAIATLNRIDMIIDKCRAFAIISNVVPELDSYLLLPMASISSMKTMEGDRSSATRNSSLTTEGIVENEG
jgi:hypothetical protein